MNKALILSAAEAEIAADEAEISAAEADFLLKNYDYFLPQSAIATHPHEPADEARLLVYERASGRVQHLKFIDLPELLPADCAMIFNDTKVFKARIFGHKSSGGAVELFINKILPKDEFIAQIRGRVKLGAELFFEAGLSAKVLEILPDGSKKVQFFIAAESAEKGGSALGRVAQEEIAEKGGSHLGRVAQEEIAEKVGSHLGRVSAAHSAPTTAAAAHSAPTTTAAAHSAPASTEAVLALLERIGHVPLPPYIRRADTALDERSYQSIFARHTGAVAAPTASLHFTPRLAAALAPRRCELLTLHVGAGTFASVDAADIREHAMHSEYYCVPAGAAELINSPAKLCCVGTTVTRTVEFFARTQRAAGECDLFLHPGNRPLRADYLITNFHLPKSTLIMLVAAFIGRRRTLELYELAREKGYKFYSYGDGMLIL